MRLAYYLCFFLNENVYCNPYYAEYVDKVRHYANCHSIILLRRNTVDHVTQVITLYIKTYYKLSRSIQYTAV